MLAVGMCDARVLYIPLTAHKPTPPLLREWI